MTNEGSARGQSDGATTGSQKREARTLTGSARDFNLADEIASLKE